MKQQRAKTTPLEGPQPTLRNRELNFDIYATNEVPRVIRNLVIFQGFDITNVEDIPSCIFR